MFVLSYIEGRAQGQGVPADDASLVEKLLWRVKELEVTVKELSARLAKLAGAEQQAAELRRSVDTLKAHNKELQETIRTLEIGFRRHVSERVSPDQLRLALAAEPEAPGSPSVQVPPEVDGGNVPLLRTEGGLGTCSAVGWAGRLRRRTGPASASPALSISSAARRIRRLTTTEVPAPSAQATCGAAPIPRAPSPS